VFSRSALPLAVIATLGFLYWAMDAPTLMGDGGYVIWTPLVFGVAWIVASVVLGVIKVFKG